MKIISNFKDYYDSMQQYGKDDSIVFPRINKNNTIVRLDSPDWTVNQLDNEIKDETLNKKIQNASFAHLFPKSATQKLISSYFSSMETSYTRAPYAFLKSIYTVVNGNVFKSQIILARPDDGFQYKIIKRNPTDEDCFEFIMQHKHFINQWKVKDLKHIHSFEDFVAQAQNTHLDKYSFSFNSRHGTGVLSKEELLTIHQEVNNPIYFIIDNKVAINLPLTYFGINKLFDNTEILYQEISYCLGNVINNKNEPPAQISNDMKIQQHGFDNKISFRKRV